jgi:hypothetical protein
MGGLFWGPSSFMNSTLCLCWQRVQILSGAASLGMEGGEAIAWPALRRMGGGLGQADPAVCIAGEAAALA